MKGFLATLFVVCAIIGGIWFAYEPYIKPFLEERSGKSMSDDDTLLTKASEGTSNGDGKPATPTTKAPSPAASKGTTSSQASASPSKAPATSSPSQAPKTKLDRLLEEKYPMPEIIPLMEIVDNWQNVPPRAYPPEVVSQETVPFDLVVNGQVVGSSSVAPGTPLKPLQLVGDQLTIANQANPGMNAAVPVDKTDFKQRIEQRYDQFVEKTRSDIMARRERVRAVVEADPAKMAVLTGETPPPSVSDSGDPRFNSVKDSLRRGEAASVTLEEAKTFTWNGREKVSGEFSGTYDTVTVHFEVATIFGRFPVDYKCLLQGGRVVGWIDPITEERI